jgi:hypothetical protein
MNPEDLQVEHERGSVKRMQGCPAIKAHVWQLPEDTLRPVTPLGPTGVDIIIVRTD